jgi:hypothetical protein
MTDAEKRKIMLVEARLDGFVDGYDIRKSWVTYPCLKRRAYAVLALVFFRGLSFEDAEYQVANYFNPRQYSTDDFSPYGLFLIWPGLPPFARCPECVREWNRRRFAEKPAPYTFTTGTDNGVVTP